MAIIMSIHSFSTVHGHSLSFPKMKCCLFVVGEALVLFLVLGSDVDVVLTDVVLILVLNVTVAAVSRLGQNVTIRSNVGRPQHGWHERAHGGIVF